MSKCAYRLYVDCGRNGCIDSCFVECENVIKFVENYGGLSFVEVLGKHSEIYLEPGEFEFTRLDVHPEVVKFLEMYPSGPAPDSIENSIETAYDAAIENPLDPVMDHDFMTMLKTVQTRDAQMHFYDVCLDDALKDPQMWVDTVDSDDDFWTDAANAHPAKMALLVAKCTEVDPPPKRVKKIM